MNILETRRLLTIALVLGTGCGSDNKATPDAPVVTPDAPPPPAAAISLSADGHLVDSAGKTLYVFANDVPGAATNCGGTNNGCVATWPLFYVANPTVGTGLTASDFTSITPGGMSQTAWKGRPLYYHTGDSATAPTSGENVGPGRWFVARAYNLYFGANAAVTPLGSTAANAPFFTNGAGRTLYAFKNDVRGTATTPPTANGPLAVWPAWVAPASLSSLVLPSTITASDVTSFTNAGMQQFAYKGWPLYFYSADTMPGQVAGAAVNPLVWKAVNIGWDGTFP